MNDEQPMSESERRLREELDRIGQYRPADMRSRLDAFLRDHPGCAFCEKPSATAVVGNELDIEVEFYDPELEGSDVYAVLAACETHAEKART